MKLRKSILNSNEDSNEISRSKSFSKNHRQFLFAILFCIISLIIYYIFAITGWMDEPHFCIALDHCYCERLQTNSLIAQRSNTVSNLALVVSGLVIIFSLENADKSVKKTPIDKNKHEDYLSNNSRDLLNPMHSLNGYSLIYSYITMLIGIGSFYFHGLMTMFGGVLDLLGMNMFLTFILIYDYIRMTILTNKSGAMIFVIINIIFGVLSYLPNVGRYIFSGLVFIIVIQELLICLNISRIQAFLENKFGYKIKPIYRDIKQLIIVLVVFGISFIVWDLSKTGGPLCNPDTIWQGHTFWHLGVGLATYLIFEYLKTERENKLNSIKLF